MKRLLSRRQCLPLLAAGLCPAAETSVSEQWRRIASETDGTVGAMALHLSSGRTASLHGDERFPLASVCKLPIAAHILAMVDEGRLSLDEELTIPRYDVWPGVSVVAERWPKQRRFRLDELVEWMVAKSDNTAVQTLFRIGGGPKRHGRTPSPVAGGWDTPGSQRAPVYARRRGSAAGSTGVAVDARDVRQIDGGDPARGAPRRDARVPGRPPRYGHSCRHGSAAEESSSPANCSPRS